MSKFKDQSFQILLAITLALCSLSVYINQNNDYLTYRDVNVTYIDRHASNSCHKGSCRDNLNGLFRTDEGYFFERPISLYTYSQMRLGEKFPLNLRPMDIKQTSYDNIVWMIGPSILYALSFALSCLTIYCFFEKPTPEDKYNGY